MPIPLRMRVLCAAALLSGIMLVAGCSVDPAKSPPAPITSSQTPGISETSRPSIVAPSPKRAALRAPLHRAATLKSKRHIAAERKRRLRARLAKRPVQQAQQAQQKVPEPETAGNSGVVHHVGPRIVPLD